MTVLAPQWLPVTACLAAATLMTSSGLAKRRLEWRRRDERRWNWRRRIRWHRS